MMTKKFRLLIVLAVFLFSQSSWAEEIQRKTVYPEVVLNSQDRILVLAPHPDDEIIGCCGILQKAIKMKLPVQVVFLTYGDNNQWSFLVYRKHPVVMPKSAQGMGLIRHDEAVSAEKIFGLTDGQLTFLGYPDFRTFNIWYYRWGNRPPARSMLTRVSSVPYANALRPGAPYKGEEILKDLKTVLKEFKPTKIFLSHPADHNGDHQTFYLFTRVALWDLKDEVKAELYPYLVHFKKWPLPRGYYPEYPLEPPDLFDKQIAWKIHSLTRDEIEVKRKALKKHWSQYHSSATYLLSFIRANELFGDYPVINLTAAPAVSLGADKGFFLGETPEHLTEEEKANFVGIEERYVYLENGNIVISLKLSRPLAKTVGVTVYLFGYRSDKNFAEMPKICLRFGAVMHNIYNQNKKLPRQKVKVLRKPKEITMYVPLEMLGDPEKILNSVRTSSGAVSLDWVSWRTVEIHKP